MRAVFLLVSLWVLPNAYQALRIPLPNAVLIRGEPVGPITASHREKRAEKDDVPVSCRSDQYKPSKKNYCCTKCIAGFKVAKDCSGAGQATECVPCDSETYMDTPNHSGHCESCSTCLLQYGQTELSECTAQKDTQCGCPPGHFKQSTENDFICQECSICQNGTTALECHDDKDTICRCHHGFFLDHSDKTCRPCSECQESDCKNHCPDISMPIRSPQDSNGTILIVLGVVLGVTIAAVAVYITYTCYTRRHSSYSDTEGISGQTSPMISHPDSEDSKLTQLPGYTYKEEHIYVTQQSTNQLSEEQLPLPDITKGTPPCLNSPKVLYAIIESIPIGRWKEFVRLLGLSNHTIEACEHDHRYCKEAQYAMLQIWIARGGCLNTKRDQLFNVLQEINLGGCIEKIKEHL